MSDIGLSVTISNASALKEEIESAVKSADTSIKLKIDKAYLKESINSIKGSKVELGVNKSVFYTNVRDAINAASKNVKTKLQIDVDQSYLNKQVQNALKDLGKFVNGAGKNAGKLEWEIFDPNSKTGVKELKDAIKLQEQLLTMQNAVGNKAGATDTFKTNIEADAQAITHFIEQARQGELAVEEFYAKMNQFRETTAMRTAEYKSYESSSKTEQQAYNDEIKRLNLVKQGYSEMIRLRNLLDESSSARGTEAYQNVFNAYNNIRETTEALENNGTAYEDAKKKMAQYTEEAKKNENTLRENGQVANSLSDKLQRFKMHLTTITSIVRAFQMLRMVIQPIVNAVTEVDTAMTQLKIVTQENDAAIQQYSQDIMEVADRTAGSIKDLVSSTTTFARLGYDLPDATKLAEYTQMLENVGAIDESSATSAITAIIKAFDMEADDLESVMDKMVIVGNNFPISVSELAEGLNNASSILSLATGDNLEQSMAMLTAANTTVQNISKSSTGLRTIVARIRNVKTELDDLGEAMTSAEYDEVVQALTKNNVALTDQAGNLRNTYDVLLDLSEAWKDMSESEQAALAKTLSGTIKRVPGRTEMCAA